MSYFGRRTLYTGGLVVLFFILIGIGGCGLAPANATIIQTRQEATIRVNKGASWGAGSLLLIFTFIYGMLHLGICEYLKLTNFRLHRRSGVLRHCCRNVLHSSETEDYRIGTNV